MRNCLVLLVCIAFSTRALHAEDSVTLKQVNYLQLEQAIQRHKGKVVLVDVWSLGCTTCLKKFPSIVQLHRDLAKDGLVVISLTTDEPEDLDRALEFLKSKGAHFPNYLIKDTEEQDKKYYPKYPKDPQPMLWLFNRKGEKVVQDEGRLKPEQLLAEVQKLLAEK